MAKYTVEDSQTNKRVTFEWNDPNPPTDADMEEVFAQARQVELKPIVPLPDYASMAQSAPTPIGYAQPISSTPLKPSLVPRTDVAATLTKTPAQGDALEPVATGIQPISVNAPARALGTLAAPQSKFSPDLKTTHGRSIPDENQLQAMGEGARAMIPFAGKDAITERAAKNFPSQFAIGAAAGGLAQGAIGGAGMTSLLAKTAMAKSPLLLAAASNMATGAGIAAGQNARDVIEGKQSVTQALTSVAEMGAMGLVPLVPGVFIKSAALQPIAQPAAQLVFDVASGKAIGRDVGSRDWWMNEAINLGIGAGFGVRDMASGETFYVHQKAQREELKRWLSGKKKVELVAPNPTEQAKPIEEPQPEFPPPYEGESKPDYFKRQGIDWENRAQDPRTAKATEAFRGEAVPPPPLEGAPKADLANATPEELDRVAVMTKKILRNSKNPVDDLSDAEVVQILSKAKTGLPVVSTNRADVPTDAIERAADFATRLLKKQDEAKLSAARREEEKKNTKVLEGTPEDEAKGEELASQVPGVEFAGIQPGVDSPRMRIEPQIGLNIMTPSGRSTFALVPLDATPEMIVAKKAEIERDHFAAMGTEDTGELAMAIAGDQPMFTREETNDKEIRKVAQEGEGAGRIDAGGEEARRGGGVQQETPAGGASDQGTPPDNVQREVVQRDDGTVELRDIDRITKAQWSKISAYMKRKGYDYRGGDDAKELYARNSRRVYNSDQAEALLYATKSGQYAPKELSKEDKHRRQAIRYFGITKNIRLGGYILPDGRMLDLSGARQGNIGATTRALDHREIGWALSDNPGGTEGMQEFMSEGNIRMDANSGSVDIAAAPTSKQLQTVYAVLAGAAKSQGARIDLKDGAHELHRDYPERTNPHEVLKDIQDFYSGKRRGGDSLAQQFHKPGGYEPGDVKLSRENAPAFYSPTLKAVQSLKQEKGTGDQFLAMITKAPGVKEAEWKWMDLDDFLKGKKSVTKAEVEDFVKKNQVEVQEVSKSDKTSRNPYTIRENDDGLFDVVDDEQGQYIDGPFDTRDEAERSAQEWWRSPTNERGGALETTKYSGYTLPGGENYREVLLTLPVHPTRKEAPRRIMPGKETEYNLLKKQAKEADTKYGLMVRYGKYDEAQPLIAKRDAYEAQAEALTEIEPSVKTSDLPPYHSTHWGEPNIVAHARLNDRTGLNGEKILFVEEIQSDWARDVRDGRGVPNQPFLKNWEELTLKKVLRMAAEEGYDRVAWINGKQTADRYDLSKQIGEVVYEQGTLNAYDHSGNNVLHESGVPEEKVADYIGKDAVQKLLAQSTPQKRVSGLDLKVGGEWATNLYDRMIPKFYEKYGKKWGAKVEPISVGTGGYYHKNSNTYTVVEEGEGLWAVYKNGEAYSSAGSETEAESIAESHRAEEGVSGEGAGLQQSIAITPEMKKSVLEEGQPMFQRQGASNERSMAGAVHSEGAAVLQRRLEAFTGQKLPEGEIREVPTPDDPAHKFAAETIAPLFGTKLTHIEVGKQMQRAVGSGIGGVFDPAQPDRIFVNASTRQPALVVAGHELLHQMGAKHPDLLNTVLDVMREEGSAQWRGRTSAKAIAEGMEIGKASEEVAADFVGDQFTKASFWQKLAERSPEAFKKAADLFKKILDKVLSAIDRKDPLFNNVERVRNVVADAVVEFQRREGSQASKGEVKFSKESSPFGAPKKDESWTDYTKRMGHPNPKRGSSIWNEMEEVYYGETAPQEAMKKYRPNGDLQDVPSRTPGTLEKSGRPGGEATTHQRMTHEETTRRADEQIAKLGEEGAKRWIFEEDKPSSTHTAVALKLIDKYQSDAEQLRKTDPEKSIEKSRAAIDVATEMSRRLTAAGQEIEALKLVSKLSPEGVTLYAQQIIDKANKRRSEKKQQQMTTEQATKLREAAGKAKGWGELGETLSKVAGAVERMQKGERNPEDIAAIREYSKKLGNLVGTPKEPKKDSFVTLLNNRLEDAAKKAAERLRARGKEVRLYAGIPLDDLADYTIIGTYHLAKAGTKYADWAAAMVKQFGVEIEPHLKKLFPRVMAAMQTEKARTRAIHQQAQAMNSLINKFERDPEASTSANAEAMGDLVKRIRETTGDVQREAAQELQAMLQDFEHVSFGRKLSTAQAIAQLINPKTISRNLVGNELFYWTERAAKLVAAPVDWTASKLTGKDRTITFRTEGQGGYWEALMRGMKAGWKGVNPEGITSKADLRGQTFKDPKNPLTYLERVMGASMRGFDYAAYVRGKNNVLGELAALDIINNKRQFASKDERRVFVKNFIENADDLAQQIASDYGKYVTFQDDNKITELFIGTKKVLNKIGISKGDFGLGDLVLKYAKTPANLLARAIDYSPIGVTRDLVKIGLAAARLYPVAEEPTRRQLVQAVSRSLFGAGLSALGLKLIADGVFSGTVTGSADKDKDVKAFKAEQTGERSYSVNADAILRVVKALGDGEGIDKASKLQEGDHIVSYDWAQPLAMNVAMTADVANSLQEKGGARGVVKGIGQAMYSAADAGINTLAEQSVVKGIQAAFGGNKTYVERFTDIASGIPASFVPTLLKQARDLIDNTKRSAYSPNPAQRAANMVIARVPFVEETLPAIQKTFGKETAETYQGGTNNLFNVLLNPAFVSRYHTDKNIELILGPYNESGEKSQLPRIAPKKLELSKAQLKKMRILSKDPIAIELTGQQIQKLQKLMATHTERVFKAGGFKHGKEYIGSAGLRAFDPDKQASIMASTISEIANRAEMALATSDPELLKEVIRLAREQHR